MTQHDTLFDDQLAFDLDSFDAWDEDAIDMAEDDEPIEVGQ